jgi:lactate dehydrogenase-like 2-hydroxyacid dehydrogenase
MPSPRILITRASPGAYQVPGAEIVTLREDAWRTQDELVEAIRAAGPADAVVTMAYDIVDRAFLDACGPGLRAVCNFAVGYDNIDLALCLERGVIVTNTPDAVTEGTADMTWALLLAAARRLEEASRYVRSGDYVARGPLGMADFLGADIAGRTLLIVGAGRIGKAVALRSLGWGMRILYTARSRHLDFEQAPLNAARTDLDAGLREADYISLHCPLTPETRGLINAQRLAQCKPTAVLINTARGPIVDEAALAEALASGRLRAAGIDVYEREPEVHPRLKTLPNAVLTPHIGSASEGSRLQMTAMVSENLRAVLAGEAPPNRIG